MSLQQGEKFCTADTAAIKETRELKSQQY